MDDLRLHGLISGGKKPTGDAITSDVLSGKTFSNGVDVGLVGVMPNRGSVGTVTLDEQNEEYTIPQGYHNGLGKVKSIITGLIASVIKAGTTVGGILGTFTSDATAIAGEILSGKTAYVNGVKITGTIVSKSAATITPGTTNQTIASGQYLSGVQTIAGDSDLIAANIKAGINIFGILGTLIDGTNMKKYATGTLTTPVTTTNFRVSDNTLRGFYKAEVSGLTFKPRIVLIFDNGGANSFTFCYDAARFFGSDSLVRAVIIDGLNTDYFIRNTDGYAVTSGGFILPHRNPSAPITWFAFE